jgi:hypothetical protein
VCPRGGVTNGVAPVDQPVLRQVVDRRESGGIFGQRGGLLDWAWQSVRHRIARDVAERSSCALPIEAVYDPMTWRLQTGARWVPIRLIDTPSRPLVDTRNQTNGARQKTR